jgi:hypothetical protein
MHHTSQVAMVLPAVWQRPPSVVAPSCERSRSVRRDSKPTNPRFAWPKCGCARLSGGPTIFEATGTRETVQPPPRGCACSGIHPARGCAGRRWNSSWFGWRSPQVFSPTISTPPRLQLRGAYCPPTCPLDFGIDPIAGRPFAFFEKRPLLCCCPMPPYCAPSVVSHSLTCPGRS